MPETSSKRPTTPRSIRIALVVNPFTLRMKGGDHAPALAREFISRGHTVRGFGAPPGAIPRSSSDPIIEGGVATEDGLGLLGFQPDVIVAYDATSPAAWLGARRARKLHVPLLLVEEGFPEVGHPVERMLRASGRGLWGAYVRRTAFKVVALDAVASAQARREGFRADDIHVLPPGVDLTHYRPGLSSNLPFQHGIRGRILLRVGQLQEGRDLDVLIEAFARTVGKREDWSLVFAGTGSARGRLRALVDRLGIGARVHWIARPRREELPGLLGASTLLAITARDNDVRTLIARRALACGLPVIASDVPRLRELVEHDGCGLLATPSDIASWTATIQSAASSPMRRERWGLRGREIAEECFAWPQIADEFERSLLEAHASSLEGLPRGVVGSSSPSRI
ncbi:MAG: glycosyltransferase [Planctomycetota bacterium]|nr:MAG: glycosyltransferase [Planctomycetota bacterium]